MQTRPLPTGTLTFVFTDIEGSTRLLHELGDEFRAVLERHHEILQSCWQEHGGIEIKTDGDDLPPGKLRAVRQVREAPDARTRGPVRAPAFGSGSGDAYGQVTRGFHTAKRSVGFGSQIQACRL